MLTHRTLGRLQTVACLDESTILKAASILLQSDGTRINRPIQLFVPLQIDKGREEQGDMQGFWNEAMMAGYCGMLYRDDAEK